MKIIVSEKLGEAISQLPKEPEYLESLSTVADMTYTDIYDADGNISIDAIVEEVQRELEGESAVAGVGRGTNGATVYFFVGSEERALAFVAMARQQHSS
jgi:hypothetical protein